MIRLEPVAQLNNVVQEYNSASQWLWASVPSMEGIVLLQAFWPQWIVPSSYIFMWINDWNEKRRTTFPRGSWECVAANSQWLARNFKFPSLQKVSRCSEHVWSRSPTMSRAVLLPGLFRLARLYNSNLFLVSYLVISFCNECCIPDPLPFTPALPASPLAWRCWKGCAVSDIVAQLWSHPTIYILASPGWRY